MEQDTRPIKGITEPKAPLDTSNDDIGHKNDPRALSPNSNSNLIQLVKLVLTQMESVLGQHVKAESISVTLASDQGPLDTNVLNFPASQTINDGGLSITVDGPLTNAELRANPVIISGAVTTGGLTNAELRATPVPISGTVATGGLTNTELRASPVPVSVSFPSVQPVNDNGGSLTVDGPLTNAELRATPVPISGTVVTGGLTDTQLRASAVPVSVSNFPAVQPINDNGGSLTVDGPLTNIELRASPVPISGSVATGGLTDAQLRATPVPISGTVSTGGLTDAQLRAVAVPVSGTFFQATQPVSGPLTDSQLRAVAVPVSGSFFQTTQPVSGPLTDTQLRATAVPVSGTFFPATQPISVSTLPLPAGASSETTLLAAKTDLDTLVGRTNTLGQKTSSASMPVVLPSDQTLSVVGTIVVDTSTLDQHRGYCKTNVSVTTADQSLFAYTVPIGKTFYLLRYLVENDNTGGLVKIGINSLTTEPTTTTIDSNFLCVLEVQNYSTGGADSKESDDFSAFPRKLGIAGDIVKILVTQSNSGSTNWRTSMEFYLK